MKLVFDGSNGDVVFERIHDSLWVSIFHKDGEQSVKETRELPYSDVMKGLQAFRTEEDEL